MKKATLLLGSFLLFLAEVAIADPLGCIVQWNETEPVLTEVLLPRMIAGKLQNSVIEVENTASIFGADTVGSFCFGLGDKRLAYVLAYYHATKEVEFYNELLTKLGRSPLPLIKIRLLPVEQINLVDDTVGFANPEQNRVTVVFHQPAFDETVLLHEIGHLVFNALAPRSDAKSAERSAIEEAFADLVVTFFNGNTRLFTHKLGCEPSRDLNSFVRIPDLVKTFRQSYQEFATQPDLSIKCPKFSMTISKILAGVIPVPLDDPQPHYLSRIISQPLVHASARWPEMRLVFFKTFLRRPLHSLSDFVKEILSQTSADVADARAYSYLQNEFAIRGIK